MWAVLLAVKSGKQNLAGEEINCGRELPSLSLPHRSLMAALIKQGSLMRSDFTFCKNILWIINFLYCLVLLAWKDLAAHSGTADTKWLASLTSAGRNVVLKEHANVLFDDMPKLLDFFFPEELALFMIPFLFLLNATDGRFFQPTLLPVQEMQKAFSKAVIHGRMRWNQAAAGTPAQHRSESHSPNYETVVIYMRCLLLRGHNKGN